VRTASVVPSGENAIASPGIERLSATGLPVDLQRDISSKRTTPAESLVASSLPLGSTATDVIWLCDARMYLIANELFWSSSSRSLRVSSRFWSLTPGTA